jgi:hypothetical protein
MDPNFEVLMILAAVPAVVGLVSAVCMSHRVREYGLIGALRRALANSARHNPYSG